MNKKVAKKKENEVIQLNEKGTFKPTTIEGQLQWAGKMIQHGMFPSFKSPQQLLQVAQRALDMDIPLSTTPQIFANIKGKVQMFGDGPLMVVQRSGKLEYIQEFLVDKNGNRICYTNKNLGEKPFAAVCQIKRKGDEMMGEGFFTVAEAATAGLYKNQVWQNYEKAMLKYRARTIALKEKFADVLSGVDVMEYMDDGVIQNGVVVENKKQVVSDIDAIVEQNNEADCEVTNIDEAELVQEVEESQEVEQKPLANITEENTDFDNTDQEESDEEFPDIDDFLENREVKSDVEMAGNYLIEAGQLKGKRIKEIDDKKLEENHNLLVGGINQMVKAGQKVPQNYTDYRDAIEAYLGIT